MPAAFSSNHINATGRTLKLPHGKPWAHLQGTEHLLLLMVVSLCLVCQQPTVSDNSHLEENTVQLFLFYSASCSWLEGLSLSFFCQWWFYLFQTSVSFLLAFKLALEIPSWKPVVSHLSQDEEPQHSELFTSSCNPVQASRDCQAASRKERLFKPQFSSFWITTNRLVAIMKAAKDAVPSFISDILKSTWKTYINDLNFNLFGLV